MKRLTAFVVASVLGLSTQWLNMDAKAAPAEGANVALASAGSKATASGQETAGQWGPALAIDGVGREGPSGKQASRWSSEHSDAASITVELANPTVIDHVNIDWEEACAPKFQLQVSNDGQSFTDLTEEVAATCDQVSTPSLVKAVADQPWKYVKMQGKGRTPIDGKKYGISLWEFEVWNGPEPAPEQNPIALVPLPAQLEVIDKGTPFTLTQDTTIDADTGSAGVGKTLADELRDATGFPLATAASASSSIKLRIDEDLDLESITSAAPEQGYSLEVAAEGVTIIGKSAHGVWNGTRTLLQLLPSFVYSKTPVRANWTVPDVSVLDAPRFEYRSQQIDMARSFLTVDEVKNMIDTLSSAKGSYVHLHLADDQGWRIEITNDGKDPDDPIDYSLLTKRGSLTGMTEQGYVPEGQTKPEIGRAGYYTQAEYKEIQDYAKERFITVIPEVDVPAHTNAALYSIPQLNTPGSSHNGTVDANGNAITEPAKYLTAPPNGTGAVGYSYLDPDSKATKQFLTHVFTQLAKITEGPYVHQGGDESHDMAKRYSAATMNEFLSYTSNVIREAGKHPIGWSEIAQNTMQPGDGVQYWVGNTGNVKRAATQEGVKVVMAQSSTAYVDMQYGTVDGDAIGLKWAGTGDFPKYYNWDPATVIGGLDDQYILGTEATQWSETIRGGYQAEWLAYPRVFSLAEVGWTPQAKRNVTDFATRMASMGPRMTVMESNFYDGPNAKWQVALAGIDATVSPEREVTLEVGQFAAPRTKLTGESGAKQAVSVEPVTDPSASTVLTGPFTATIDWGDGTNPTPVTFTQDQPRDPVHASGMYTLQAAHVYAKEGTYQATIMGSDGRSAPLTITVVEGAPDPVLDESWDPSVQPKIAADKVTYIADDRASLTLSGFEPDSYIQVSWAGEPLFLLKSNDRGEVRATMPMIATMVSGKHSIEATQGQRKASVEVTLVGGKVPLQNPIDHGDYSIADFSSEETSGEAVPNGRAAAAIDGNQNTYWHSKWSEPAQKLPQFVTVKLSALSEVTGFEYTPRQDQTNGLVKDYKIYVSEDGASWGEPVASGAFTNNLEVKVKEFEKSVNGQYVKFEILSNHGGDGKFATIGELRIGGFLGKPATDSTKEPTENPSDKPTDNQTDKTVRPGLPNTGDNSAPLTTTDTSSVFASTALSLVALVSTVLVAVTIRRTKMEG